MIAVERYENLGAVLGDALIMWKTETALVEANRKQEVARYSYLDVRRMMFSLARRLEAAGVGAGTRVAICMSNQPRWLISACAVFHRGGVLVPIDYKLTGPEQAALLAHARPTVTITEWAVYRELPAPPAGTTWLVDAPKGAALPEGVLHWEAPLELGPEPPLVRRSRSDQATLVYSSGTSGRPKGCMLTHDNYLEQYRTLDALFPLRKGHRYFSVLPTNHAIDFMVGFLGPFLGGATVVHQRTLRPEFLVDSMERFEITHMSVVPLLLEAFERRIDERLEERSELEQHVFEGLRQLNAALTLRGPLRPLSRALLAPVHRRFGGKLELVFCGGAFTDPKRVQYFYELGIPVIVGYGLTEAGTVLTVQDGKTFRSDSVGAPLDGVELQIRDADAAGVGEVWVRGRTVMSGYLDDEEATREALVDGWLRTGDVGWLDASGHLHLVGRRKNMIVTKGGKNIYPEDVEGAFEGLDCEEFAVASSRFVWPGGKLTDERLVLVVREPGEGVELVREVAQRNQKLADYKRVRGVVRFDHEFPRTASMKVKREALAAELRARVPESAVESVGEM